MKKAAALLMHFNSGGSPFDSFPFCKFMSWDVVFACTNPRNRNVFGILAVGSKSHSFLFCKTAKDGTVFDSRKGNDWVAYAGVRAGILRE